MEELKQAALQWAAENRLPGQLYAVGEPFRWDGKVAHIRLEKGEVKVRVLPRPLERWHRPAPVVPQGPDPDMPF